MDRQLSNQQMMRERATYRYLEALDTGDIDGVIAVLQLALYDAPLEEMILEAHEAYFQDEQKQEDALVEQDTQIDMPVLIPMTLGSSNNTPKRARQRTSRWLQALVAVLIAGVLIGSFMTLINLHNNGVATQCGSWTVDQGLLVTSSADVSLVAVTTITEQDIWAVGNINFKTLVVHWNGKQWSVVPSPNNGSGRNELNAISALSTNDIWAVGSYDTGQSSSTLRQTLIEHWDGKQWKMIPGDPFSSLDSSLQSVVALSPNNVWAVGYFTDGEPQKMGPAQTLVEHWDGQRWHIVQSPNSGAQRDDSRLFGIAAISANDIWAVGDHSNASAAGAYTSLIEHWDGKQWSVVPGANMDGHGMVNQNQLTSIAALSARDIWAVGYSSDIRGSHGLIEHWNGQKWQVIAHPDPVARNGIWLLGITAVSNTNIWAVGYFYGDGSGNVKTLIEHWDGKQWNIGESPDSNSTSSSFHGIASSLQGHIVAVGITRGNTSFATLIVRSC